MLGHGYWQDMRIVSRYWESSRLRTPRRGERVTGSSRLVSRMPSYVLPEVPQRNLNEKRREYATKELAFCDKKRLRRMTKSLESKLLSLKEEERVLVAAIST